MIAAIRKGSDSSREVKGLVFFDRDGGRNEQIEGLSYAIGIITDDFES